MKGQTQYDSTYLWYLKQSETQGGGERVHLMGTEFQLCKIQRVLEMDSGADLPNGNVLTAPALYTEEWFTW